MQKPEIPYNEKQRLQAVKSYQILDTLDDHEFDDITLVASEICQTPISVISIIDENRQWFKAKVGLDAKETSRDVAFCAHAINKPDEILIIPDARLDERFHDNPLVAGNPNIVFYAGVPLVDEDGFALGTLCAIDTKPKTLTEQQLRALKILAKQVMDLISLKKKNNALINSERHLIESINFNCPYFILINKNNEIVELGDNYGKSIKGIQKNSIFSDYFIWESQFNPSDFLSDQQKYNKLLFFNSIDGKQKFKCSVKKQNSHSYFIFANAVINSNYLISNYNLKITDFPKQDFIAEFLFLQQAATSGLEDFKRLNTILSEKNKELEISKKALINSNSVLEHQVNERTKKIKNLALFPEQNPNPVLELDYEKKEISYLNPVAKQKTETYKISTFDEIIKSFNLSYEVITKKENTKYEFQFKDETYEVSVYFLENIPTLRLYLHNITEIRLKEKLEKTKQDVFIQQQKVLLDLRSISQELTFAQKLEVIYRKTSSILKCDRCSVWLYNDDNSAINAKHIYVRQTDTLIDGMSLYSKDFPNYFNALAKDEVISATDAETHSATNEFAVPYLKPLNIVSMLDIPIIKSNKSIGVICNEYIENKHEFTENDIAFAQSIADVISLAFETEQLLLSKLELKEKNESLQHAYNELINLQSDLINQEKLATLGLLIAGIAHEVNTPLGAIKASNDNIKHTITNDFIKALKVTDAESIKKSIDLFMLYKKPVKILSTREEREIIKSLDIELNNGKYNLSNTLFFARKIYELGHYFIDPSLNEFINHPNNGLLFSFTSNLIKVLQSIDTINIAVDKASKVVKALNNFSHGNMNNEITNFNLRENIESIITILWNKIKYGSSVVMDIDESITIMGNQEELSQVWTNIINNALQASGNKCIIKISYSNNSNGHEITFSNNGPEIPKDVIPKIFDAFYSTKKRGEGTGLGLNIVKKIIEKHKGHIICSSEINETKFIITLPNL